MRSLRRLPVLLLLGLLWHAPLAAQDVPAPGTAPIQATDLYQIRQLGDVTLSPDGRQVVYTVRSIVETPEADRPYGYRTHLYGVSADGREAPRALTSGEASASDPAWHPDGDQLAFVRPVDGTPQVFVLPMTGGEARQLTAFEHGATAPRWSPDGTRLLFASRLPEAAVRARMEAGPEWPSERPGRTRGEANTAPDPDGSVAAVRAWLDRRADADSPRVLHRLDLQGEHTLEARPRYRHLFVVDLRADTSETPPAPRALTDGFYDFEGGTWTGDGRVVFSGAVVHDRHPDRVRERDLFVVGVDGSGFRRLLRLDGYRLSSPLVAPGGHTLAFLADRVDDPGYAQTEVGLLPLDPAGPAELLTLDFDRDAGNLGWSADGWHLYFTAASDGGFPLYRAAAFDVAGPSNFTVPDTAATAADALVAPGDTTAAAPARIERLTGFDRGIRSYAVGRAATYFVGTDPTNPYELYSASLPDGRMRRLSAHNASWLRGKRLSTPEAFTLTRDALTIDYWVMKPAFYEDGQTYPLLLQIHGGPMAMWGPGEATMWHELQFFAAQGYAIVFANPRGSGGYGHAFKRANYQDWGHGPAGDVLAAAEAATALPWVDADRQVVTGGSYAGYLTAWIVAHDHRFRAAVAQRGVYDLPTFLGEGNAWRLVPSHFGGFPWNDAPFPEVTADAPAAMPAPATTGGPASDSLTTDLLPNPVAVDTLTFTELEAAAPLDTTASAPASMEAAQDTLPPQPTPRNLRELLIAQSPLTFVKQIETPLLIIHGDRDLRTGVIQSEVLYKSLKLLGRPVEYVRYPDAGHDLSRTGDPQHRLDRVLRIYEFMERFIHDPAPLETPPAPAPGRFY